MILSKKDLKKYIDEDKKRNIGDLNVYSILFFIKWLYGHEGIMAFRYLRCLRHLEYSINCFEGVRKKILVLYYKIKLNKLSLKYNISIAPNTCGYGLWLLHFRVGGGIIINCKKMGNYCIVNSGVIVGNKDSQENVATIGDYVELTIGSKVIGKVKIGNHVIVAPNSVVIKDIPDYSVVSGVPAKIIKIQEN